MLAVARLGVLRFGGRGDPFGDIVLLQVVETALQNCLFACVESGFSTVRGMFWGEDPTENVLHVTPTPFWGHRAGLSCRCHLLVPPCYTPPVSHPFVGLSLPHSRTGGGRLSLE